MTSTTRTTPSPIARKAANLRCLSVSKSFGGLEALKDVSIEFPLSGITAILGPNGAGKSTLLNLMTGFIQPDGGSILLDDRELLRHPAYRIAQLGVRRTFQDLRLIMAETVQNNVRIAGSSPDHDGVLHALFRFGNHPEQAEAPKACELLRFVGLEKFETHLARQLSYGQQKLLALACCLATDPAVLLLDEPVAGVDPNMTAQIASLLLAIRKQGRPVILIEHDFTFVRQVADFVIVMEAGKVIASGSASDVLSQRAVLDAYLR